MAEVHGLTPLAKVVLALGVALIAAGIVWHGMAFEETRRLWRDLFDKLEEDHALGEQRIRHLEHALLAYEMMGDSRREAFETAVRTYVNFYLEHMALEEGKVLPMAERVLTEQDWIDLDEAFGSNRDPLTGHEPDDEYRSLFSRIVNAIPSPIGLGEPRQPSGR